MATETIDDFGQREDWAREVPLRTNGEDLSDIKIKIVSSSLRRLVWSLPVYRDQMVRDY